MTVNELSKLMGCTAYGDDEALNKNVDSLYIGDLLSWVMGHAEADQAWLTVQSHINIIAVALLKEVACVVIIEDAEIPQETLDKANEEHLAILSTPLTAYEFVTKFNTVKA
ncbi:MAG: hypothetical protein IKM20_09730 [Erysipelotrichales bacterium]|nr:hypothetical protein [Erysipelotrichales bacterium]